MKHMHDNILIFCILLFAFKVCFESDMLLLFELYNSSRLEFITFFSISSKIARQNASTKTELFFNGRGLAKQCWMRHISGFISQNGEEYKQFCKEDFQIQYETWLKKNKLKLHSYGI